MVRLQVRPKWDFQAECEPLEQQVKDQSFSERGRPLSSGRMEVSLG